MVVLFVEGLCGIDMVFIVVLVEGVFVFCIGGMKELWILCFDIFKVFLGGLEVKEVFGLFWYEFEVGVVLFFLVKFNVC